MKRTLAAVFAGALAFSSCSTDVLATDDGLTAEERAELLSLVSELPFFDDDFGVEGVSNGANMGFDLTGASRVAGPQNWGRRRGRPVNRETVRIETDTENRVVTLIKELEFDGEFLVLNTETDQVVRKPLREIRTQTATFQRLNQARADEESGLMHRWSLVAITPAVYEATNAEDRLVAIDSVTALVNGSVVLTVVDPSALIRVEDQIARLAKDSSVEIRVFVSNRTSDQSDPAGTFVYLHLRHAATDFRAWRRVPMDYVPELQAYVANWTIMHRGRERIVVDALDAETISVDAEAPYHANIWGIPYRTLVLRDTAG